MNNSYHYNITFFRETMFLFSYSLYIAFLYWRNIVYCDSVSSTFTRMAEKFFGLRSEHRKSHSKM